MAGSRIRTWPLMPTERMGPPPGASPPMRMTASWSGSNDPTVYKFVARRCPQWRAPLGSSTDRHRQTPKPMQKAPVAVHHRSACSGVKALRNTSHAKAASRQALLAFRSLDPFRALREPDSRRRDEERPSRSEQRTLSKTKTTPLTGKAPYKFESSSLQRGDGMGQAARKWHHRRCSQLMECPDAPAERLEQVPRRPGPR